MKDQYAFELLRNFILISNDYINATTLSLLLDNKISHDRFTRFLNQEELSHKHVWKWSKPFVKKIKDPDGVLIIDDTIIEKPYSSENSLIGYYWSSTKNKTVKGIQMLSLTYLGKYNLHIPIDVRIVEREKKFDEEKGKECYKIIKNKNELFREMVLGAIQKNLSFSFILGDNWYASSKNMNYIKKKLKKDFIFPLQHDRLVREKGKFYAKWEWTRISDIPFEDNEEKILIIKGVSFPVKAIKIKQKHSDGTESVHYLCCSHLGASKEKIIETYQRRWAIEEYHKSLKQNFNIEKSPQKKKRSQMNFIYVVIASYILMEKLKEQLHLNHYKIKKRFFIESFPKQWLKTKNCYKLLNIA
jgi:2C-methyl-D-erythritol 2,4-cyclodiphosphate synthase